MIPCELHARCLVQRPATVFAAEDFPSPLLKTETHGADGVITNIPSLWRTYEQKCLEFQSESTVTMARDFHGGTFIRMTK